MRNEIEIHTDAAAVFAASDAFAVSAAASVFVAARAVLALQAAIKPAEEAGAAKHLQQQHLCQFLFLLLILMFHF